MNLFFARRAKGFLVLFLSEKDHQARRLRGNAAFVVFILQAKPILPILINVLAHPVSIFLSDEADFFFDGIEKLWRYACVL